MLSTALTPQTRSRWIRRWWLAAVLAGVGYGAFLIVTALRLPAGTALTEQFGAQPAVKALMAVLLAVAATAHPIRREARWLVPALLFSAAGDFLLAMPWWAPSFVAGLAAFLLAHLCFLGALIPLVAGGQVRSRLPALVIVVAACLGLLAWFWPTLAADALTIPVTVYMLVLAAMVGAALLAGLPTAWTAVGAVCFAVSDAMIGISEFIRHDQLLAVPIWWAYGAAMVLITRGLFFTGDGSVRTG